MRLVLFQTTPQGPIAPGALTDRGVVSLAAATAAVAGRSLQETMTGRSDHFDGLRPALEREAAQGAAR